MGAQTILFRGDDGVAVSIEIEAVGGSYAALWRFHPERADSDTRGTFSDPDELADAIEDHVTRHYHEAGSRSRTIQWVETAAGPIMARHLGRFGVPLLALDTGANSAYSGGR